MQHLLRRKITVIFTAILVLPLIGHSQLRDELNLPDHDSKRIHFGINLGYNRAHFSFAHDPYFLSPAQDSITVVESLNSAGLNLAWLVNFNLSEHFDVRTFPLDLTFTEKAFEYKMSKYDRPAGEDSITTKKIQSISLTFPLQLKFSSDRIGNMKVYMMGGVKAEFDMASNAGARKAEQLVKLKKLDYGVQAALGFHFYFEFFVLTPELRVDWGLSNLHSRDPNLRFSSVIDKIYSRQITFSLTVE
jgi:hypothetical protein